MSGDLYQRLGIGRGASADEIKKAYRTLAREHHPDKGGDPELFKGIQEAHEVLSDDRRRQIYDATGSVNEGGGGPPGGMGGMAAGGVPFFMSQMGPFGMPGVNFDMGDLLGSMFGGGGGGRRGPARGGKSPDKHQDVGLRLEQFYKGTDIKLKFNQARRCGMCNATGAETTEPCGAGCNGTGFRMVHQQIGPGMVVQSRAQCDACSGSGKRVLRMCKGCQGKKFIQKEKVLDIKVLPGMVVGETLTFAGECSDMLEYDAPGDVVLDLKLAVDGAPKYEWHGVDLTYKHYVSFAESILGFECVLSDHPSGESPKYSWRGGPLINGSVLKMEGGGMPKRSGGFGVLHLQICVRPPPTVAWSAEDAAKLASVLGAPSVTIMPEGVKDLLLDSAESVFN
jgi:DnaJ family protein A protein 2